MIFYYDVKKVIVEEKKKKAFNKQIEKVNSIENKIDRLTKQLELLKSQHSKEFHKKEVARDAHVLASEKTSKILTQYSNEQSPNGDSQKKFDIAHSLRTEIEELL